MRQYGEHAARVKSRGERAYFSARRGESFYPRTSPHPKSHCIDKRRASPSLVARDTLIRFTVRKRSEMNRRDDRPVAVESQLLGRKIIRDLHRSSG